jgi:hypothetical protein
MKPGLSLFDHFALRPLKVVLACLQHLTAADRSSDDEGCQPIISKNEALRPN